LQVFARILNNAGLLYTLFRGRPAVRRLQGCTIRCNDALSQHIHELWTGNDILAAVRHAEHIVIGSPPSLQLRIHLRIGPLQFSQLLLKALLLRGLL
jgi:hypothetical protein